MHAQDEELRSIPVVIMAACPRDVTNQASARRATAVLDKAETRLDDLAPLLTTIIGERESVGGVAVRTVELPSDRPGS
jgi:hypothetical protein